MVFHKPTPVGHFRDVENQAENVITKPRTKARIRKTRQGSANDIGWPQESLTAIRDQTPEFSRKLEEIRTDDIHDLPRDRYYCLIPGLFSNPAPLYLLAILHHFVHNLGLSSEIAQINSQASVDVNARMIKDLILTRFKETGMRTVLLGHSKGGVDAEAACSMFWPQLKDIVEGLILVQSPYAGNPIASDLLREGQFMDAQTRRFLEWLMRCVLQAENLDALEDLTYDKRKEFLARHPMPEGLRVVSFHTEASQELRGMKAMSRTGEVADVVPRRYLAALHLEEYAGRHITLPINFAMAAGAKYLQHRYGESSDGLVTRRDAEIPGSIIVKPEWKANHAWMVLPLSKPKPNSIQPCHVWEALCGLLF